MPAAFANLLLEQGIPTDIPVADWKGDDGEIVVIQNWTGELGISLGPKYPPLVILHCTINSDNVAHFPITAEQIETLVSAFGDQALEIAYPVPTARVGIFEVRLISDGNIPYSVVRGNVYVILAVLQS
jgi:hypothetical protein